LPTSQRVPRGTQPWVAVSISAHMPDAGDVVDDRIGWRAVERTPVRFRPAAGAGMTLCSTTAFRPDQA
jgi:hypothetical protein